MRIGAHVGVAGGYAAAVDYAVSVGCECLQVFAKSPRQWNAKPFDPDAARAFRDRVAELDAGPVFVHTSYLINLGSSDDDLWRKSYEALADELRRGELLGARGVITHTGTAYKENPAYTAQRIAGGVDRAWELADVSRPRILLENTAGAGTTFGDGPQELGTILALLGESAGCVGVCLDTCHAHAAGWDLSRADVWNELVTAFEWCCGMPIEAVHANDCMFAAGLHKDRHAWVGDGTIGYPGFAAMFAEERLRGVPAIIEMPGDVPRKDVENITRLKRLRDGAAGS
jgi:deoxyribonuclease-4